MAAQAPPKKVVVRPPRKTRGYVSAQGVSAEIETIEPILRKHQQEAALKISQSLQQKVEAILPKVTKNLEKDQIPQVAQEIATETVRETLENLAKIQDLSQVNQVIADSLTQSIIAHPQIPQIKITQEELYAQSFEQTKDTVQANSQNLEKAAVLGSIAQVAELKKPNQQALEFISDQVRQTIETQAPLTPPATQGYLTGALGTYLTTYVDNFEKNIVPSLSAGQIPSFDQLQKIKDATHNQTVTQISVNVAKSKEGKVIDTKIGFEPLTIRIAGVFGLASPSAITQVMTKQDVPPYKPKGFAARSINLILNVPSLAGEAHQAAFLHDQERFNNELSKVTAKVEEFKKKKSLNYRERIEYSKVLRQQKKLQQDQQLQVKKPGSVQRFRRFLTNLHPSALNTTSQAAWGAYQVVSGEFPGIYAPQIMVANRQVLGGITFGSLSFRGPSGVGSFNLGSIAAILKGEGNLGSLVGMGKAPIGLARRVRDATGLVFGGLLIYFWSLGQAALTGFLIGAGIGAITGGSIGFALAAATGPLFPLTVIPFTLGGAFVGASVFGVAGGLIALGFSSGSATAIATGVGVGAGGTTGAVIGGILGSALGPFGTFFGAIAGAYIGSLLGGALGYAIGHYVIGTIGVPATGALTGAAIGFYIGGPVGALVGAGIGWLAAGGWRLVEDFLSGAAGAGAATGIAGFITGMASGIWGGITGAAGATFGFLSGAANFVVGGLSSISVPASMAAIPVAGSLGAIAIGGTIIGIVTATSFFNPEGESNLYGGGDNEFFSITKTANTNSLRNEDVTPPKSSDITYTLKVKAKKDLTSISITDTIKVDGKYDNFSITSDKDSNPISPPCINSSTPPPTELAANNEWTCIFTITAQSNGHDFRDSVITNIATVNATSESNPITDSSLPVFVIIGNPPVCETHPCGWPATGTISFGPNTGHHDEAIDIAPGPSTSLSLYSTINGLVSIVSYNDCTAEELNNSECDANKLAGNYINIVKGSFRILYAHMDSISINQLDQVTCRQEVGIMGYTGWTDPDDVPAGTHLHYAFKEGGTMAPPNIPANPSVGTTTTAPPSCVP